MRYTTLFAPTLALALAGCVVGPDYKQPGAALPAKFSEAKKQSLENAPLNPWWEAFRDRRLNALVDQGMNENLDVLSSLERIVEAQANVVLAGSGALPQVDAAAAANAAGVRRSDNKHSPITRTASAGLGGSWLLDFFGQYKRSKESANALLDAAYNNVGVARLAYFSDLTATYVDLRYYQEAIALSRQNLASRRVTLKLVNDLKASGSAYRLDVVQAEGLVEETLSEIPALEIGYLQSANHIATLLGQPAATLTSSLARGVGQPIPRVSASAGIPADLIRNRPDIKRAERLLAAATADIGVAEAQLYPSISLGGNINGSRFSAPGGSVGLLSWSFGPSLSLPLLDGGSRRAEVDIAKSTASQQYIAWKQTVLNAVEEVEDAQISVHRRYQAAASLRRLVKSNEEALSLARESYKAGTATLLDTLAAERNVADGRLTLAATIRDLGTDYIALNVAIGGGSAIGAPTKIDLAAAK